MNEEGLRLVQLLRKAVNQINERNRATGEQALTVVFGSNTAHEESTTAYLNAEPDTENPTLAHVETIEDVEEKVSDLLEQIEDSEDVTDKQLRWARRQVKFARQTKEAMGAVASTLAKHAGKLGVSEHATIYRDSRQFDAVLLGKFEDRKFDLLRLSSRLDNGSTNNCPIPFPAGDVIELWNFLSDLKIGVSLDLLAWPAHVDDDHEDDEPEEDYYDPDPPKDQIEVLEVKTEIVLDGACSAALEHALDRLRQSADLIEARHHGDGGRDDWQLQS